MKRVGNFSKIDQIIFRCKSNKFGSPLDDDLHEKCEEYNKSGDEKIKEKILFEFFEEENMSENFLMEFT